MSRSAWDKGQSDPLNRLLVLLFGIALGLSLALLTGYRASGRSQSSSPPSQEQQR